MYKVCIAVFLFGFFSMCNTKNEMVNKEFNYLRSSDSLRKIIMGKWGGNVGEPVFEIRQDSIYYYEKDSSFLYQLKGDTFSVQFNPNDTFTIYGKLKVSHDTLKIFEYHLYNQTTFAFRH